MKIVAFASQKGGSGKSTACIHLAVEAVRRGLGVAIADLDPQTSAMAWKDGREEDPAVVSLQPTRLAQFLDAARKTGADYVFIDSAPNADTAIAVAEASDYVVIPCRPSILDLRAIATTARIVRLTAKPASVVLNCVPVRAPLIVADAREAVGKYGLPVAPVVIHQRSVFSKSMIDGKTASEYEHGCKGGEEISLLFDWLDKTVRSH
jgi:chromosome partitioning protein